MTNNTSIDVEQFKTFAEQWKASQKAHGETCPNCGYCPHCGRGQQAVPYNPNYPNYPRPYYGGWWGIYPPTEWPYATFTVGNDLQRGSYT